MTVAERRYKSYSAAYDKKEAELASRGQRMSEPKMTPGQYFDYYQVAAQEFAGSKNVPKLVVEIQAREYSVKQAKARAKAMKEMGIVDTAARYSELKYKGGLNKDFDRAMEARYAEARDEGLTSREARELIGAEFYFSDDDTLD